MQQLRTAVIGAGKMGAIHAKVLSQLPQSHLVAVVDVRPDKAASLAGQYGCQPYTDPAGIVGSVEAVTIAAPTVAHFDLAQLFLSAGVPVLIEKPLAFTVDEGRKIVDLARQKGTIVAVGHSERCNPVVQAMKRLQIKPKFIESSRISPYSFRSTDIGVVMDVMIHDIDIILSLAASAVRKVDAFGVNVIGHREDICNARIIFENGCVANVTASRVALKTERKVRVFSRQAYLSLDYLKKEGIIIKASPNVDVVKWIRDRQQNGDFDFSTVNWTDLLHIEQLDIDDKEPLRLEQESFLRAVSDSTARPEVTGEEGLEAMVCAERILQSLTENKWD